MGIRKNKSVGLLLQIFIVVFLFGTMLLRIRENSVISNLGYEDIYWERARFLLGQGGASSYTGSSLCSIGYSLILVPVCALLESPYAAYKAALLLNGVFLCGSYVVSLLTARKLFPEEGTGFLSAACLFLAFCPILASERYFTGPELISMFLIWCICYLLAILWEGYKRSALVLLALCTILLGWMKIALFGGIVAVVLGVAFLYKKKKSGEADLLFFVLAVFIGLAAGNIAERAVLSAFCGERDIYYTSSFELLLGGIADGWKMQLFFGLFSSAVGKLYAALIGSILLICPGLLFLFKQTCGGRKQKVRKEGNALFSVLLLMFLIQLVVIALFDYSGSTDTELLSLCNLSLFLPPVILCGMVYVRRTDNWKKELAGYLLLLCVCTFLTFGICQTDGTAAIAAINSGILVLFQNAGLAPTATVCLAAGIIALVSIVIFVCLKWSTANRLAAGLLRGIGALGLAAVCLCADFMLYNYFSESYSEKYMNAAALIASVLSEGSDEQATCYYLLNESSASMAALLQSLMPEQEIVSVTALEQDSVLAQLSSEATEPVIITGTKEELLKQLAEELPAFKLLYMTDYIAVWAKNDSSVYAQIEKGGAERIKYLSWSKKLKGSTSETNPEKLQEVTTSTKTLLAAGTYQAVANLECSGAREDFSCTVTVQDADGTITTMSVDDTILDDSGKGSIGIRFSGSDVMREFQIKIKSPASAEVNVAELYCFRSSLAYTEGINNTGAVNIAGKVIRSLDAACGLTGTVAFVEDIFSSADVSSACLEEYLPDYEVTIINKEELENLSTEYLIGATASHAYFDAMEDYSVIRRTDTYTVLVRNDSEQYRVYEETTGETLSSGTEISISAISGKKPENTSKISLEAGTYSYHVVVSYDTDDLRGDEYAAAGVIYLYTEDRVLASVLVRNRDLTVGESGTAELELPFVLRTETSGIKCRIEADTAVKLDVVSKSVELLSQKYQYGWEEEEMETFFTLINSLNSDAVTVSVMQSEAVISSQSYEYSYLQEQIPGCAVQAITYEEASDMTEDTLLITRGLTANFMKLLDSYSIIGHAGQYTLWALNNGQLLQQAVKAGAAVLNSGNKISLSSLAAAGGTAEQYNAIAALPKGAYTVTIELDAADLRPGDVVEVELTCDKSADDIEEEVQELIDADYTEEEARATVDTRETCGNGSYDAYLFHDSGKLIVQVNTSNQKIENLAVDLYTWQGNEVEGSILWVELK